ncbi:MAG: hypothetical protein KIT69_04610 [Propionibacteriaceae bacterium]|nr:hypothetical protein [Propionibacteriaceae bacterium]
MGSLLHPVGPEEPRVYWVRRSLVVVVAVALVVALAWLVWPKEPTVSAVPPPTSPTSTPSVTTTPSTPAPSSSPSPTPTGPVACDPTLMKLGVAGFQKVKVGAKDTAFTLTVTNNTKVACILTISPKTYKLTVTSGKDRIWSTADCEKWLPAKEMTLDAGATHEFGVKWTLRRSSEGCKLAKDKLKPGTYVATGTLDGKAAAKQPMQLVK